MHRWAFLFFVGSVSVGLVSCHVSEVQKMTKDASESATVSTNSSLLSGAWVQYVPDGEWGTALEVYDFLPNGRYRIIVGVLPESGCKDALSTALSLTGHFVLKGDTVVFRTDDGVEKSRKFEVHDECLFLKGEKGEISILRRVTGSDVPASHTEK